MMCREFRDRHPAYLDRTLAERELVAIQAHLASCARCARYDTAMRRGLMMLRNLPAVQPSPDFFDRLNQKLHRVREAEARAAIYRGPGVGSFMATAAGVVVAGFLAAIVFRVAEPARNLRLSPVVAMRPATPPPPPPSPPLSSPLSSYVSGSSSPEVTSALVASASVGLPVWPAAMMAEQAQVYFAATEMGVESW